MEYSNKKASLRLQRVYNQMIRRCYNTDDKSYKTYGARGISVCDEWLNNSSAFYKWAYETGYDDLAKTGEYTIERIDVNGNYCPDNCTWKSLKEQARNRRNTLYMTYKGEKKPVSEVAEIIGVSYQTLYDRLSKGLSDEEAVDNELVKSHMGGHQVCRYVTLVNMETKEVFEFDSYAEASRFLGRNDKYIQLIGKRKNSDTFVVGNYYVTFGAYHKKNTLVEINLPSYKHEMSFDEAKDVLENFINDTSVYSKLKVKKAVSVLMKELGEGVE